MAGKTVLEEAYFQEDCEGGGKRLGREKGGRGIRTENFTPPSQANFSLHFCILLAGVISSLELSQALTSKLYEEKSERVLKTTHQGY